MFQVQIGQTFYEIVGREPEIFEFTVDEYVTEFDESVSFPNKYIGLQVYSEHLLGSVIFCDRSSAEEKLKQIRRVMNERNECELS